MVILQGVLLTQSLADRQHVTGYSAFQNGPWTCAWEAKMPVERFRPIQAHSCWALTQRVMD